jgi:hypothetical protein
MAALAAYGAVEVIRGLSRTSRAPVGTDAPCDCPDPVPALSDVPVTAADLGAGGASMGVDIDAIADVPLRWGLCSGFRNLGNALARRVLFLRDYLNAGMTDDEVSNLRGRVQAAIEADPRVQRLEQITLALNAGTQAMTVGIFVSTSDGPLRFIVSVSALTVDILDGKAAA